MKLSWILKKLEELRVDQSSYVYGTLLDYCGFPHKRSLLDKETGLIYGNFRDRSGNCHQYEFPMCRLLILLKIRYRVFHTGRDLTDSRILIVTPIEVDIPMPENKV